MGTPPTPPPALRPTPTPPTPLNAKSRKTPGRAGRRRRPWAHPRVGGENVTCCTPPPSGAAHPRVGGENQKSRLPRMFDAGSSPRGRGKLTLDDPGHVMRGLIPAWAGKTTGEPVAARHTGAHPRVGGENRDGGCCGHGVSGSSPRGRGKLPSGPPLAILIRLIPAWAGKTLEVWMNGIKGRAHPRVGGENQPPKGPRHMTNGSSPRGRGKRFRARAVYA